jgi:hypothetical protein
MALFDRIYSIVALRWSRGLALFDGVRRIVDIRWVVRLFKILSRR